MPDFENIKLRAPYRALVPARQGAAMHDVVDAFDCVVRVVPPEDAVLVATFRHRAIGYGRQEFVSIEGRLFRPLMAAKDNTAARSRENPPLIRLVPERLVTKAHRSYLLGSPFGPCMDDCGDWLRARARKADPDAYEDAGLRVRALASQSMVVLNGVLHHEARSPAWSVSGRRLGMCAAMPDLHDEFAQFVDPRYNARELADFLELGREFRTKLIGVHEPSLLPPTTEEDALAAIALRLLRRTSKHRIGELDPHFVTDILVLLQDTEAAIAAGESFETCYDLLESVASWTREDEGEFQPEFSQHWIAKEAALFLELRAAFPPRTPAPPGDDIEVGAFRR